MLAFERDTSWERARASTPCKHVRELRAGSRLNPDGHKYLGPLSYRSGFAGSNSTINIRVDVDDSSIVIVELSMSCQAHLTGVAEGL